MKRGAAGPARYGEKLDCLNPNLQETQVSRPPERRLKPAPCRVLATKGGRRNLRGAERCPVRVFKEMSGAPKSRSTRMTGTNAGSPKGREPYGDAGPVVVVRVTPHQGGRESRPQGEGGQVTGYSRAGRYA